MAREQIALDEIVVRLAKPADLDLRMEIMGEAAAWLVAKGIDQWPSPLNNHWRRRPVVVVCGATTKVWDMPIEGR